MHLAVYNPLMEQALIISGEEVAPKKQGNAFTERLSTLTVRRICILLHYYGSDVFNRFMAICTFGIAELPREPYNRPLFFWKEPESFFSSHGFISAEKLIKRGDFSEKELATLLRCQAETSEARIFPAPYIEKKFDAPNGLPLRTLRPALSRYPHEVYRFWSKRYNFSRIYFKETEMALYLEKVHAAIKQSACEVYPDNSPGEISMSMVNAYEKALEGLEGKPKKEIHAVLLKAKHHSNAQIAEALEVLSDRTIRREYITPGVERAQAMGLPDLTGYFLHKGKK